MISMVVSGMLNKDCCSTRNCVTHDQGLPRSGNREDARALRCRLGTKDREAQKPLTRVCVNDSSTRILLFHEAESTNAQFVCSSIEVIGFLYKSEKHSAFIRQRLNKEKEHQMKIGRTSFVIPTLVISAGHRWPVPKGTADPKHLGKSYRFVAPRPVLRTETHHPCRDVAWRRTDESSTSSTIRSTERDHE